MRSFAWALLTFIPFALQSAAHEEEPTLHISTTLHKAHDAVFTEDLIARVTRATSEEFLAYIIQSPPDAPTLEFQYILLTALGANVKIANPGKAAYIGYTPVIGPWEKEEECVVPGSEPGVTVRPGKKLLRFGMQGKLKAILERSNGKPREKGFAITQGMTFVAWLQNQVQQHHNHSSGQPPLLSPQHLMNIWIVCRIITQRVEPVDSRKPFAICNPPFKCKEGLEQVFPQIYTLLTPAEQRLLREQAELWHYHSKCSFDVLIPKSPAAAVAHASRPQAAAANLVNVDHSLDQRRSSTTGISARWMEEVMPSPSSLTIMYPGSSSSTESAQALE